MSSSNTAASPDMVPFEWLKGAFAMRAAAYANMFDVLRETYGVDQAVKIVSEATRRMGATMGDKFKDLAPGNLEALRDRFINGIPAGDKMFAPEVLSCDSNKLDIKFHRCPLKEAWLAMGRSEEDVELLCKAAAAIDGGLFKAAGFFFSNETWRPGDEGCCRLIIEPGK
jgi:hypothetical protein